MTTKCSKCNIEKPTESFHKDSSSKTGHKRYCKDCATIYRKERYWENVEEEKLQKNKRAKQYKEENIEYVFQHFLKNPCIDCGEKNPVLLEFDHIQPDLKKGAVSDLVNNYSLEAVKEEIQKCVVRCANCHRMKTAVERDYVVWQKTKELIKTNELSSLCKSCGNNCDCKKVL